MKRKFVIILISLSALIFTYCVGKPAIKRITAPISNASDYDPKRGEGKFTEIELGALDKNKAKKGRAIYDVKCHSCHKLTDERLVGPGWKGVTERHRPEWILNFITDPDPMLDKDPKLLAQMELCLIRMPNQQISDSDAFAVLEFMRQNDGVK